MITLSHNLIQDVLGDPVADICLGHDTRFHIHGDKLTEMLAAAADMGITESTPVEAMQTNTSFITRTTIWKFFRTCEPGLHPDVEVTRALHRHVPEYLGHLTHGDYTTAIVSRRLDDATNVWDLRDDLQPHLRRLGAVIKDVHEDLAEVFPTGVGSKTALHKQLTDRLDLFCERTPLVQQFRDKTLAAYVDLPESFPVQRIHADLHLAQILYSDGQYFLIDFEGEPTVPLAQRRLPDSPMRDLAGMVRSFDYAQVADFSDFFEGYGPISEDEQKLLHAYVVDKLMYEVDYDFHHRKEWLHVPVSTAEKL